MAKTRKCHLCGKEYKFCSICDEDRYAPVWKNSFHSEDCSKIFQCCVDYNMSLITKDEAKSILLGCDLSDKKIFREDAQEAISKILAEDKPKAKPFAEKNTQHEVV